jgi:large subunit ribosomal protein L15
MMLEQITKKAGRRKRRRRVGRGRSSGLGKTCGRGHKGCHSRSGGGPRPLTEGGQMPLFRRLPKRGFSNDRFATSWEVVNLADLERRFETGANVSLETLQKTRLVRGRDPLVKVLAKGKLAKRLTVAAHAFSAAARQAIEAAGGTVTVVPPLDRAAAAKAKRNSAKTRTATARSSRLEKKKSRRQVPE